jgi:2-hydroxy-6-oxonona-2,4-dienedioate hydrolase
MRHPLTLCIRHEVVHAGRHIVWRQFGEGPPLVLLHGGHGDWRHWQRNIDALAAHHTLWLPDMPGFGESDKLPGSPHAPDRLERLLDAVEHTLGALVGSEVPVDLAGFSFGGLVAAKLALRRPVRRLALVGAAGHGGPRRLHAELRDWRMLDADPAALKAVLRANLAALMLADPTQIDDETMAVYEAQCRATRFRSRSISKAGGLREALAAFAGPVLLLWGEHDPTATPRDLLPQLAAGRNGCAWEIVDAGGHWVQYEVAGRVSARLGAWFGPVVSA